MQRYHARSPTAADAVLVVGSDYTDVGTPTEFSYNARIAANLGAPVLLVLNGFRRTPARRRAIADIASGELHANHGSLVRRVANRVAPDEAHRRVAALDRRRCAGVRHPRGAAAEPAARSPI